jgi:hypothetical protein
MASDGARVRRSVILLSSLLVGCALPARRPLQSELDHAGEIAVTSPATAIAVEGATDPLPPAVHAAAAAAAIETGPCIVGLPFRPGGTASPRAASFDVAVTSARLVSGPGVDPLAVLELELRGTLTFPPHGPGPERFRPVLRSAFDPVPRALSSWLAGGGRDLALRAAFLAEEEAAELVAEAIRAPRPGRCSVTVGAHATSGTPGPKDAAPSIGRAASHPAGADADASPAPVMEWTPTGTASGLSPGVAALLGAFHGMAEVSCPMSEPVIAAICFPVNLVAAAVGAAEGASSASTDGAPAGADAKTASEAQRAWAERERIWRLPLSGALERQRIPARFAAAQSQAGRALDARVARVRFVADPSSEDAATIEIEIVEHAAAGSGDRWLCMRGPGPIKLWHWIKDEGRLLGHVLDAQLGRAVSLFSSPPSGGAEEGRCGVPEG